VVKECIHVAEHERRAPELALALDPRLGLACEFVLVLLSDLREVRPHRVSRARHRAVIETQKRLKIGSKKRATTATHHAVGSRHRDDVARWNKAFCSLLFFKVQQTVHTKMFYSGPLFVRNSPAYTGARPSVRLCWGLMRIFLLLPVEHGARGRKYFPRAPGIMRPGISA
jgi:hypothetical protein